MTDVNIATEMLIDAFAVSSMWLCLYRETATLFDLLGT